MQLISKDACIGLRDPLNSPDEGTDRLVFSDGVERFEEREFFRVGDSFPWGGNQPDNNNGGEFCIEWQNTGAPDVWNDFPCLVALHFICRTEKPRRSLELSTAGISALIVVSVVLFDLVLLLGYIKYKRRTAARALTTTSHTRNAISVCC